MTGLVRKATLLMAVCGLLAAGVAVAAVPDPGNSSFDKTTLNFVAHDGTAAHYYPGLSRFTVNVQDAGGNFLFNSVVVLDFSNCTDVLFCEDQFGNSTADCPTMTLRKPTDVNGDAVFDIIGAASADVLDLGGSTCNCVQITADGYDIVEVSDEPINAGTFDYNNDIGVTITDLSFWLALWGQGEVGGDEYTGDLNHSSICADCPTDPGNCATNITDLSIWLAGWGSAEGHASNESCSVTKCGP